MPAIDPATTALSLVEILQARADQSPDTQAFLFLIEGEVEGPRFTFAELDRAARAIAAALQDVAGPGDRAMLLYGPGLEFVAALFGCQYAGVVPVPAYPPRLDLHSHGWKALASVTADCHPRVVLTGGTLASFLSGGLRHVPALNGVPCLVTDQVDASHAGRWRMPKLDPEMPALLQYTSGSTAAPRGVVVSHQSLMHSERLIQRACEHEGPGVGVCWLPTYHDFGLIGGVLQSVFHGALCVLLSPLDMIRRPFLWLQAVSRYRADTSGGPNFGYDFCVQRISAEEKAALDLRNWSVAGIGSEPVSQRTLDEFAAAFSPCGFRPEAFYPCYGLAEATLFVTGGPKGRRPVVKRVDGRALESGRAVSVAEDSAGTRTFVGCGRRWPGQDVRIVDPDRWTCLADGCVGEIWVAGPSVATGYWNRPDETEQTFRAFLRETSEGPFLRTGDLGFLQDGELFVTGRIKDVIIVRGRNHYPQDIEATVQPLHPGLRAGAGAAFEFEMDGRAGAVVVQEVERRCRGLDVGRLLGDARQAVAEQHELLLHDLLLLEPGSIPRTSSGKVRRHACRQGYERGELRPWKARGA